MEIKYKVLTRNQKSPYMNQKYNLRRWYHEPNIGKPGKYSCVSGLYAVDVEGLLYRGLWRNDEQVYRCKVKGKHTGDPPFKTCYEYLQVLEPVPEGEVREMARGEHDRLGYLLEEALYPVHPFGIKRKARINRLELDLLKVWASVWEPVREPIWDSVRDSVRDSVGDSVRASIGASVRDSVGDSVRDSVGDSVRDSVWASVWASVWEPVWEPVREPVWDSVWVSVRDSAWAYIGSLFPNIQNWKYTDHKKGEYPYAAGAKLWRAGLVPSYDGLVWRLQAGPKAEVVWEGTL